MALQEMDLTIVHRSGKKNANADALSRFPMPSTTDHNPTQGVVATPTAERNQEEELVEEQRSEQSSAT
jgi:hypothetical protein